MVVLCVSENRTAFTSTVPHTTVSSSSGKMKYNAVSIPVTAPSPIGMQQICHPKR